MNGNERLKSILAEAKRDLILAIISDFESSDRSPAALKEILEKHVNG